tara:strand:+ start:196 stop:372 length:177 start_codon:yes stop_codon:yes gene_type:complete
MGVRSQIILEKFKKQLTNDIIEALDEKVVWPDIDGTLVPNLVKKIINDRFDEYARKVN